MKYKVFGQKKPDIVYRERQAVYGIFSDDRGHVALVQKPRGFFLPGGGKEPEEKDRDCLERELMEELGWKVETGEFLGEAAGYYFSPTYGEYHFGKGRFYEAFCLEDHFVASEKEHYLQWVTFSRALKLLYHAHQRYAVETYSEKLNTLDNSGRCEHV